MKRTINVGNVILGNGNVVVQSMTNTPTTNILETVEQIKALSKAGAELVRVSIPDISSAKAIAEIVKLSPVPIIGDIHFTAEPALIAIENGISKIRINPYNMSKEDVKKVVKKCIEYNVPIRVGVNKGSAKVDVSPKILAEKAIESAKIIEDCGWDKIVLAVKSSNVKETVQAYRELAKLTNYPLHIGLTESGTVNSGSVKSAIAIGSLILDGIGDTVRVSFAGNPIDEVVYAKRILQAVGINKNFVEVIACPTCARTTIEVEKIANSIEKLTAQIEKPLKVAVMGCVVNGIGESKGADLGVAGGKDKSVIFVDSKQYAIVENSQIEECLFKLIREKTNDK